MFNNSTELLDYALRELQVAVQENKTSVDIVLKKASTNDLSEIKEICERLAIKTITQKLREEFNDYQIESVVKNEGYLTGVLTFDTGPCLKFYPLVWKINLQKKEA